MKKVKLHDTTAEEFKFAMVCSSNMNRSMEAHKQLKLNHLNVESFGVGTHVRLPAPNNAQAVFNFGTPYREIYQSLSQPPASREQWYRNNGLLDMVERNMGVKDHPERWQNLEHFDFNVVFCFEERVFEALIEDVVKREISVEEEVRCMHVINLEVQDNPQQAAIGAQIVLEFCLLANQLAQQQRDDDKDDDDVLLEKLVEDIQTKYKRRMDDMVPIRVSSIYPHPWSKDESIRIWVQTRRI